MGNALIKQDTKAQLSEFSSASTHSELCEPHEALKFHVYKMGC